MQDHQNPENRDSPQGNGWPRANIVFLAFLAVAAFYLITEHRAHVFGYLPFLLLLACPFLHMFMHGGHGGHGDGRPPTDKTGSEPTPSAPRTASDQHH